VNWPEELPKRIGLEIGMSYMKANIVKTYSYKQSSIVTGNIDKYGHGV
jgi:hypothetical protein